MPVMTTHPFSTDTCTPCDRCWHDQRGVTLIELLVAMLMALVVSFAAFSILEFASGDVSRITERVHADQTGRTALEKIMLQLHSACVAEEVNPIVEGSTGEKIKFVSENGTQPAFSTVYLHEIIYTPAAGKSPGTLTEKTYKNTGEETKGNYPFSETPSTTTKLLTGVEQTGTTPIFLYYRYYRKGDPIPSGHTELPYGELYPTSVSPATKAEAEEIVKVTVSFTLAPEAISPLRSKTRPSSA